MIKIKKLHDLTSGLQDAFLSLVLDLVKLNSNK